MAEAGVDATHPSRDTSLSRRVRTLVRFCFLMAAVLCFLVVAHFGRCFNITANMRRCLFYRKAVFGTASKPPPIGAWKTRRYRDSNSEWLSPRHLSRVLRYHYATSPYICAAIGLEPIRGSYPTSMYNWSVCQFRHTAYKQH